MAWKMNKSHEEKLATQLETVLMDIDREVLLDELLKNIISVKRGSDKLKRVELTQEELLDNKVTYNVYGVGAFHRKIDIDRVKLDYDIEAFGLGNDPQKYLKYFSAMQNKGTPIKTYTWVFDERMKSVAIISENSNFVMLDISNADSVSLIASEIPNGIMRKQVTLKVKDVGNLRIKTDPNIEVKVITGIDRITVEPNKTIELEVDEMGMSRVLSKRLSKPRKLQNDLEEYDKQMAAKFKQKFWL